MMCHSRSCSPITTSRPCHVSCICMCSCDACVPFFFSPRVCLWVSTERGPASCACVFPFVCLMCFCGGIGYLGVQARHRQKQQQQLLQSGAQPGLVRQVSYAHVSVIIHAYRKELNMNVSHSDTWIFERNLTSSRFSRGAWEVCVSTWPLGGEGQPKLEDEARQADGRECLEN